MPLLADGTVVARDGRVLGLVVNPEVVPLWTRGVHITMGCRCQGEIERCEAYRRWLMEAS